MLSVSEARLLVLQHSQSKSAVRLPAADCLGLVLAEEVTSDIDSPPFDKSMVDGYAVRSADLNDGQGELEVIEEIAAGALAQKSAAPGQCWRIMTGAPIPAGADAVIMHERTEFLALRAEAERQDRNANAAFGRFGSVRFADDRFRPRQNIMRRGTAMRIGDAIMTPGHRIRPIELGLMAEVGQTEISVIPRPTVAVLSTGNELVPADQIPGKGQIRNSNGPMLAAAIRAAGAVPVVLGIRPDELKSLREAIEEGLKCDVLVISGGVSAGGLDLIPTVLQSLEVEEVFHKVHLKPGKPVWFGKQAGAAHPSPPAPLPQGERRKRARPAPVTPAFSFAPRPSSLAPSSSPLAPCLVFGLPGNPVSSLVCFELFVRPAIEILAGKKVGEELATVPAELTAPFVHRGDRPTYYPAKLETIGGESRISALGWSGSADMRTLASANALAIFAAGTREYAAGELIHGLPL